MTDRGKQIALLLQAVDDLDREFATQKTEYKDDRQKLLNELGKVRRDILAGQLELIPGSAGAQ